MDGDGIEAVGINPSRPILFDHDGDGTKNATGWISGDDGLLVLDRNGNGLIDSGRELFGDQTLRGTPAANGSTTFSNGYEALAAQDGNGDGVINASDAVYSQLRIWRDANQDGVSQANELFTLGDLGIASVNVVGVASSIDLGNGNTQPWSGSFTRADGSTGTSAVAEVSGSLLLASNNFYREFSDNPAVTPAAAALPQMGGSGSVRDLQEAMSLGGEAAQGLQDAVSAFAAATTRDAQLALIDDLLADWAATSGKLVSSTYQYNMVLDSSGQLVTHNLTSQDVNDTVLTIRPAGMEVTVFEGGNHLTRVTKAGEELLRRVNVLEVFNGTKFIQMAPATPSQGGGATDGSGGTGGGGGAAAGARRAEATLSVQQIDLLNQSYDALVQSVYGALVSQTRLKPYLNSIELEISESGISFDTTALAALLQTAKGSDERNALIDLVELNRYQGRLLAATGFDGLGTLQQWVQALPADSALRAELAGLNVYTEASKAGASTSDIYLGSDADNILSAGAGDDQVYGGRGNDQLHGGDGNDTLLGGEGNDKLYGEYGDDTLDGGAGNDALNGGNGNNTYLFGKGDGQDTIEAPRDNSANKLNTLQFKPGVLVSEVSVLRQDNSLVLRIAGTTDTVTVYNFFYTNSTSNSYNPIQQVRFDDGTVWTPESIAAMTRVTTDGNDIIVGTNGDDLIDGLDGDDTLHGGEGIDTLLGGVGTDSLYGGNGNDILNGGAGNDYLSAGEGNDTLLGGEGNDKLYGEYGDDTLDGGAGNDALNGGNGNNTYLFGKGDGQDRIEYSNDGTVGKLSTLQFKDGVQPSELKFKQVYGPYGNNTSLEVSIAGSNDTITIDGFFAYNDPAGRYNPVQQFQFADGTTWDLARVQNELSSQTGKASSQSKSLAAHHSDDFSVAVHGHLTMGAAFDKPLFATLAPLQTAGALDMGRAGLNAMNSATGGDSWFKPMERPSTSIGSQAHLLISAMAQFSPASAVETSSITKLQEANAALMASDWR